MLFRSHLLYSLHLKFYNLGNLLLGQRLEGNDIILSLIHIYGKRKVIPAMCLSLHYIEHNDVMDVRLEVSARNPKEMCIRDRLPEGDAVNAVHRRMAHDAESREFQVYLLVGCKYLRQS